MRDLLKIRNRFELRILFFYFATFVFMGTLLFRMVNMQLFEHEQYLLQSERNRINIIPVLPERGQIIDRHGRGLAVNHVAYEIVMIPERVANKDEVLVRLAGMLGWDEQRIQSLKQRIRRSRPDRPVLLADKLQWKDVAALAARLHHFPGIDVQAGSYRFYPYGALTSHLIGYISLATKQDVEQGYLSNAFVGRSGVERAYEVRLHGKPGVQREEVDAHGRRVAMLGRIPPQTGETLRLSLDVELQQAAARALGDRTGAVVVLDVHTGEVLVMLSQPGYDTNRFITGLEYSQWNAWLKDPRRPLLNRALQAAYPPASTFKLVSALAGLRYHLPLVDGTAYCPGFLELADRKLRCWRKQGHGHVNLHDAIVSSCDVYFYELGDALGMSRIRAEAERWGFGRKTGIELSPEARGNVPGMHDGSRNSRRTRWYRGVTMITAIGQGALTVTPLQVARFAMALANGGKLYTPKLLADEAPRLEKEIEVDEHQLTRIRRAMRDVVASARGTAHLALGQLPWAVAGKTGTAQVVAMRKDQSHRLQDAHRDHAWFMGFAPYEKPQVAFAVFVEHGGHGGSAAAPVAAAVIRALAARENEL